MTIPTLVCGLIMVVIGVLGYVNAEPNAEGKVSPTALIPAFIGGAIVLCGLIVSVKPTLRKHVMHAAAMLGLIAVIGGFAPIIRTLAKGNEVDIAKPAIRNGLLMTLTGIVFVALCVRSFIAARKARQAV